MALTPGHGSEGVPGDHGHGLDAVTLKRCFYCNNILIGPQSDADGQTILRRIWKWHLAFFLIGTMFGVIIACLSCGFRR
jgi:hypothetical protein